MSNQERERSQVEILDVRVKKEVEFPTDPEKRFETIFSAIGNSEAKCLTLLCLSESSITDQDLHKKFLEESKRVWITGDRVQTAYCLDTLIPIGLVAEVDTLYYGATEYITGFRLTGAGVKYGQPIAAFLLEQSAKLPDSLLRIFGQTSKGTGETRAVINRAKILKLLSQIKDNLRTTDIANNLNLGSSLVGQHLKYLAKLGLVTYSSLDLEYKGLIKYQLLKNAERKNINIVSMQKTLTQDVADLLFELKRVDCNELTKRLRNKYHNRSEVSLRGGVSKILSDFAKQGICQPELYISGQIQSQAKITEAGNQIVEEIIAPINIVLSGDETPLSFWRKISWQNYTQDTILKYKETSGHVKRKPHTQLEDEVFSIILENPGIRPKEIQSILNVSPIRALKILLENGRIQREKQGKATRYYPAG